MTVEDAFAIRRRGVVLTGTVQSGALHVGDTIHINGGPGLTVDAIEKFRKNVDEATEGDNIGVLIKSIERRDVNRGDVITSSGEAPPIEGTTVIV
jgi:elongation factor Tu